MIPPTPKDLLISTRGAVGEISFSPTLKEQASSLKKAAKTWYYPMLALKHLQALSLGPGAKNNVFFPNLKDFRDKVAKKVVVYVPGIQATVERQENDSWVVTALALDDEQKRIGLQGDNRPGVYTVTKGGKENKLKVEYRKNGRITSKNNRKVVVAATPFPDVMKAAKSAARNLEAMFGARAAGECEFDLFFSPVGSRLGNMYGQYKPLKLTQGYAFAGLLADAMEQSADKKGLVWSSDYSGAVVLTQALAALAVKGPVFKGQDHEVNMYMPPSDPEPALMAAKKLGMLLGRDFAWGDGSVRARVNAMWINVGRLRDKEDDYTGKDYLESLDSVEMLWATALTAYALSYLARVVSSPALTLTSKILGLIGVTQFAVSVILQRLKRRG